jgi:tRNA(Arg) A34 adenosine deaminase TadA
MPRANLQAARQLSADLQHALGAALARCRELEAIAGELNTRLVQANERAAHAEHIAETWRRMAQRAAA